MTPDSYHRLQKAYRLLNELLPELELLSLDLEVEWDHNIHGEAYLCLGRIKKRLTIELNREVENDRFKN